MLVRRAPGKRGVCSRGDYPAEANDTVETHAPTWLQRPALNSRVFYAPGVIRSDGI